MVPARVLLDSGFQAPSVSIAFTVVHFAESTALRAISKQRINDFVAYRWTLKPVGCHRDADARVSTNKRPQDALSLNDDRVSDTDHVEIPCGVVGTEVDAAVADVRIAL
jgi:hypothetical protein